MMDRGITTCNESNSTYVRGGSAPTSLFPLGGFWPASVRGRVTNLEHQSLTFRGTKEAIARVEIGR